MARADELRAELAALDLGERLVQLKADPAGDPAELTRVKLELRAARRTHRRLREATPAEVDGGDAAARPAATQAHTGVQLPGGEG